MFGNRFLKHFSEYWQKANKTHAKNSAALYAARAFIAWCALTLSGPLHASSDLMAATKPTPNLSATSPAASSAAEQFDDSIAEQARLYAPIYERPDDIPFPDENPYSDEKKLLGQMLFFDPRLSGSNAISCASCHNPGFVWEDVRQTSLGHFGKVLARHTPTAINLAWGELFFWDGRAESLEEQALGPIASQDEMRQPLNELVTELEAIEGYKPLFEAAFPGKGITETTISQAIATYERTLVSAEAPFDRYVKGDEAAISLAAKRGFVLFNEKAQCSACHTGWNFTDWGFHDIGIDDEDIGRYAILDIDALKHAFKTPGLRNIAERAPYMHNGSIPTLAAMVDHYNDGFIERPSLSSSITKLGLTEGEKADLIAFLKTLSSKDEAPTIPALPH